MVTTAAVVALLLVPASAVGQEGAPPAAGDPWPREDGGETPAIHGGQVDVAAFGGLLAPLSELTRDLESFATEVSVSGLFGADVTYWLGKRLGAQLQATYASGELSILPGAQAGTVPDDLGDVDHVTVSLNGRLRLAPPSSLTALRPFFGAGVGVRILDVQAIASPEVEDSTDPMFTVAGGILIPAIGPVDLRFELRDFVTVFESGSGDDRLQNDIGVTVGASVGVR